ncbi:MAG: hypothetical protein K0R00_182 [Herbinix sp.]|jgi:hypothetical protein|nr:hypothetical protein [Herbinix sp.]
MAFKYNVGYKGKIESKDLNDKVHMMLGGNVLLSGFQITPGTSGAVTMSVGSAIIKGCLIVEETETRSITLPTSNVVGGSTYAVYLEYAHGSEGVAAQCTLKSALESVALADNTLVLATVFRPYQTQVVVAGNITLAPIFKPMAEVSVQIANMIEQFEGNGIAFGTVQPESGWWFKRID